MPVRDRWATYSLIRRVIGLPDILETAKTTFLNQKRGQWMDAV